MKKHILLGLFLLLGMFCSISAQDYYIEGFYERHGSGNYTLKDVHCEGILIDGENSLSYTLRGSKKNITCDGLDATMIKFSFSKATTDCPTKWAQGFQFQFWDEDNMRWKTDVEACKGESVGYSQKDMVIMLVLDYSFSMKENISQLQSSAIKFIRSISNVSEGNVHVGIIAFSGMDKANSQVLEIMPLTKDNTYRFENFIRNASKGKETALYYSMDKAMDMIEKYVDKKNFSKDNYNGACMITFTDGLDNASINDDISVSMHRGRKNEYLAYISAQLKGVSRKYINGLPLENYAIGFSGSEDFTKEDLIFFEDVLKQTTPDAEHFKLANRFAEVEAYFDAIVKSLTSRWETLNMYVGESQHGRVRWVLNCGRAPRPEPKLEPRGKRSPWFGIGVEVGGLDGVYGGANLDMAFSFNDFFALGGHLDINIGTAYSYEQYWTYNGYYNDYYYSESSYTTVGVMVGPEAKLTFSGNNALLFSIGGGLTADCGVGYLMIGYKTKKSFYITTKLLYGELMGGSLGCGFSWGGKRR